MWTKEGPVLDLDDALSRAGFAEVWGAHVSAVLPLIIDRSMEERTIMSIPLRMTATAFGS